MGRICELVESWRPWQRRLWDLGTVLALREAVEAADWVGRRVLSTAATSWYAHESLLPRLGSDAAIGDGQVRRSLRDVCQQPIKAGSRGQRSLALLADRVEDGYLARWRDLLLPGTSVHVVSPHRPKTRLADRMGRPVKAASLGTALHLDRDPPAIPGDLAAGYALLSAAAPAHAPATVRKAHSPRAIIEAGLAGLPTIGSTRGGIPEAISDGGLLVPPDHPAAWTTAIRSPDNNVITFLGRRARNRGGTADPRLPAGTGRRRVIPG
jgi:hypothetical protein